MMRGIPCRIFRNDASNASKNTGRFSPWSSPKQSPPLLIAEKSVTAQHLCAAMSSSSSFKSLTAGGI